MQYLEQITDNSPPFLELFFVFSFFFKNEAQWLSVGEIQKNGHFDASLNAIILAQIQAVFDAYIYKQAIWARFRLRFMPRWMASFEPSSIPFMMPRSMPSSQPSLMPSSIPNVKLVKQ